MPEPVSYIESYTESLHAPAYLGSSATTSFLLTIITLSIGIPYLLTLCVLNFYIDHSTTS